MSAAAIRTGRTALGLELGSTRIKACMVDADDPSVVLATGVHEWSSRLVDDLWTYVMEDVWAGLRAAYADLVADARQRHDAVPTGFAAIGVSAMMHGYLAVDAAGDLLVPFRTWRNTNTGRAAAELGALLGVNIPLRWSIAHLRQAMLDDEEHVGRIDHLTTLAGYVHERLTGRRVLGVGDASGMFPVDTVTRDFDAALVARFDDLVPGFGLRRVLPGVLVAGDAAGSLTEEGARLLDTSGTLGAGIPFCPPEGDAGTGMVATDAVAPRTGNVSAGTSIFAMVVLEDALGSPHDEIDVVTTPVGDPVAMVHCNNGASELAAWAGVFGRFAEASGSPLSSDAVFDVLLREALGGEPDAGGVLVYNQVSGEPVLGLAGGRPLVVRTPDSELSLAHLVRAHVYGVFAALAVGMRVLADEGVRLDRLHAHGGLFRTGGVAQRFLAGALGVPVAVGDTAAEGGAWGMAVLASFAGRSGTLTDYLDEHVFAHADLTTLTPDPADAAGFAHYLERYAAGLAAERAAVEAL